MRQRDGRPVYAKVEISKGTSRGPWGHGFRGLLSDENLPESLRFLHESEVGNLSDG